jgi:hypothetical protein
MPIISISLDNEIIDILEKTEKEKKIKDGYFNKSAYIGKAIKEYSKKGD